MNKNTFTAAWHNIYAVMLVRLLFVMLLFSICRILFYAFNADMFPDMRFWHFMYLMWGGLRFDLSGALYTNILFIACCTIPFGFRHNGLYQKALQWIFGITNGIAIASNCIDFVYFRFTMRRMTLSVLAEFSNDMGNTALILRICIDHWYVFPLFAALMFLLMRLYNCTKTSKQPTIGNKWVYYPVCTVLMAAFITLFVGGVRGGFAHSTRPITISNAAVYVNQPAETGIVLNTPFSIYRTLSQPAYKKLEYFGFGEELDAVYSPVHPAPAEIGQFRSKNVVIIIVESLSKEYMGVFNSELENGTYRGYTPFLDSLVMHSRTFLHSFGNGLKSIDAMPSILASVPSLTEPFAVSVYSNNTVRGIASLLAEKSYDCSFFHGAPNGSMGFDAFAHASGFGHYYGKNEYGNNADFDGMWAIWDEPFLQFMANTLDKKPEPFLGAVFTATSHHPFRVPAKYEGKFPKGTEEIHQCTGYSDMALRRFFETAAQMSWFKNTIFVITADHTNQVSYPKSKTGIGPFIIPIIYYDPSGELEAKIETRQVTQQMDIMPTLLNYLRYDKPYFAFGFDAFSPDSARNFVINNNGFFNVYQDNFVLRLEEDNPVDLFNYHDDELLLDNLMDGNAEKVEKLQRFCRAFRQQYVQRLVDNDMTVK